MSSLKGYIPTLARILGTTPAALYERQRALVRAGLLVQSEGRGPGSGVSATAKAIGLLLISVLATDRLSEVEERTHALAETSIPKLPRGVTKGKKRNDPFGEVINFLDAVEVILSNPHIAAFAQITVSRFSDIAEIRVTPEDGINLDGEHLWFCGASNEEPTVTIQATISAQHLKEIADDIKKIVGAGNKA